MTELKNLNPPRVFYYFEQISKIPRGSGNMKEISEYCENFAKEHNLEYIKDCAGNVIIFKKGSYGYENSEPVILQGHIDMVCQKTEDSDLDFVTDGIVPYVDGDFVKAEKSTLGADNGIAVAMIFAILENEEYEHPPIEAVFTVDEEIGMLGAMQLDMKYLKARKMINLDSEEEGVVTVSCAGGGDFNVKMPLKYTKKKGTEVILDIKGLKGGHSGVEIKSGRVNSDLLMGRILDDIEQKCDFDIISIDGGDKSNAIPNRCMARLCVYNIDVFNNVAKTSMQIIKNEIMHREQNVIMALTECENGEFEVWESGLKEKLLITLLCVPNGVVEMSAEIDGLVETSLNLGILKTNKEELAICFSLRSNKKTAQLFLTRRLTAFFEKLELKGEVTGYYPPWELKENSPLRELYIKIYNEHCGKKPEVAAIHAGLECGVFSAALDGIDCISVGPEMYGVHTTEEKLSILSMERLFDIIKDMLKNLK